MKKMTKFIQIITLILFVSCSTDSNETNDISENAAKNPKSVSDCDQTASNSENNSLCLNGADFVQPSEVINYAFKTNSTDCSITWSVETGDFEILNIENNISGEFTISIATLKFDTSFSGGSVKAYSYRNDTQSAGYIIKGIELEE